MPAVLIQMRENIPQNKISHKIISSLTYTLRIGVGE